MKIDLEMAEIDLKSDKPLRLCGARGLTVHCVTGSIWVTVTGHSEDRYLAPGDVFEIPNDGLCLIEAIDQGRITLKTKAFSVRSGRLTRWLTVCTPWAVSQAPCVE